MSNLPEHLFWAIEDSAERSMGAIYRRKIRSLARVFSIPVTFLNSFNPPNLIDSLRLSRKELDELHDAREQSTHEQLKALKTDFSSKHVFSDYQIITEKPFFKAAINCVKQKPNAWLMTQSSMKLGIPNIVWQFIRYSTAPVYVAKEKVWNQPLNILAAIDPTHENDKTAALERKILSTATDIAELCKAQLHVLHCYSVLLFSTEYHIHQRLENIHRDKFFETIDAYDIKPNHTHLLTGEPEEAIENLCQTLDIDLVIMGAVSRTNLERVFIGSTSEKVVPAVDSDILLIKP